MFNLFKTKKAVDEMDFDADVSMAKLVTESKQSNEESEPSITELFQSVLDRLDIIEKKINDL